MMYVSPAVRSLVADPIEGESVTLLVEVADDDPVDPVAESITELGATVTDRRRFGTLVVEATHEQLAAICDLDGLAIVETDNAVTIDSDGAGEDVDYGDG